MKRKYRIFIVLYSHDIFLSCHLTHLFCKRKILLGLLLRQIKDFWPVALLISTLIYPRGCHADDFRATNFDVEDAAKIYRSVHETITSELG